MWIYLELRYCKKILTVCGLALALVNSGSRPREKVAARQGWLRVAPHILWLETHTRARTHTSLQQFKKTLHLPNYDYNNNNSHQNKNKDR